MTDEGRCVFLHTSTQRPYLKDALDLLFLPSGMSYRFRYHRKWLPSELIKREDLDKLKGIDAFLIHLDTVREESGRYRIREFIPVRKARILEAKFFGEFLWVFFQLGDWIYYKEEAKENELNEYHATLRRSTPSDSRDYVRHIMYPVDNFAIKTIEDDLSGAEEVTANWFRIVKSIERLEAHRKHKSIFTKLASVTTLANDKRLTPKPLDKTRDVYGFELDSSAEYIWDILQYHPYGSVEKPFKLIADTDDRKSTLLKGECPIQGRYDLLRFILRTECFERPCSSFVEFVSVDGESYLISEPLIRIRIKASLTRMALSLSLIFCGVLMAASSATVAPNQIGMGLLSTGGSAISAMGMYFLRR